MIYWHVTPFNNLKSIQRNGLIPRAIRRGVLATSDEPRVYLFTDRDTAEDAMQNWLMDEHPTVRYFAIIKLHLPMSFPIFEDEEVAGSVYTISAIGPSTIVSTEKIDAGVE